MSGGRALATEYSRTVSLNKLQKSGVIIESQNDWTGSIFNTEYNQANDIIKTILSSFQKEEADDIYNVIPFIGERGTGKTSTMLTVQKMLKEYHKMEDNPDTILDFREISKSASERIAFIVLEPIDSKMLKSSDDIIAIILARMLNYLMEHSENIQSRGAEENLRALYRRFDKIYGNLLNLNTKDELIEGESALRKLRDLSSSYTIREELKELVKEYLHYLGSGKSLRYYLVVAIDDIDLYQPDDMLRNTYTLLEQIDQFLSINGMIILTTFCESQLKISCENHLKRKFSPYPKGGMQENDTLQEIIQNIYLQFLMKMFPSNQRIYMPDFTLADYQRREQLNILVDANHSLYRYTNNGLIEVKKFTLLSLKEKTDVYFDTAGKKVHFFEFRKLRDLSDFIHLLDLLKENDHADNREWNYMKLLSYIYNQFANDRLGPKESRQLKKLEEVSVPRRSKDLVEYIREKRSKLDANSIYIHTPSITSVWKYSYGELLFNLYCASRCDIFSKQMIHCILGAYSFVLSRSYFNWIEQGNEDARDELKQVIGSSIAGRWANSILPSVKRPPSKTEEIEADTSGSLSWAKPVEMPTTCMGSISVINLTEIFQVPISDELLNIFKDLLTPPQKRPKQMPLAKKNLLKNFVRSLEILCMFFTNGYSTRSSLYPFDFEIETDGVQQGTQEMSHVLKIKEQDNIACFNIFNFVVNSFVWEEFFSELHQKLVKAIITCCTGWSNNGFESKVEKCIVDQSLKKEYEHWNKEYGSLAIPIHDFDMTYNLIKRQADGITYEMPEAIEIDDMLYYCTKVYRNIEDALKEQDQYYAGKNEEKLSFATTFSDCPFIEKIRELQPKRDNEFHEWFVRIIKDLWYVADRQQKK